jgi:hypothetical protein
VKCQHVIAYHGTPREFTTFRESQTGGRFRELAVPHEGIWFTEDRDEALWYATHRRSPYSRIVKVRLTLCNPFTTDRDEYIAEGASTIPELSEVKRKGYDSLIVLRGEDRGGTTETEQTGPDVHRSYKFTGMGGRQAWWTEYLLPNYYAVGSPEQIEILSTEKV